MLNEIIIVDDDIVWLRAIIRRGYIPSSSSYYILGKRFVSSARASERMGLAIEGFPSAGPPVGFSPPSATATIHSLGYTT
ncbi:hypothetical protein RMATCC62417_18451 [Rhizopus microsporus]|nr:hypothetical protein RMATCC62417_18451 [Rhizopus microsporus]